MSDRHIAFQQIAKRIKAGANVIAESADDMIGMLSVDAIIDAEIVAESIVEDCETLLKQAKDLEDKMGRSKSR